VSRQDLTLPEGSAGGFELTGLGDVRILDRLGEGGRSTVYRAQWNGREVALKIYKSLALERHARKHQENLAKYEYARNRAFYEAPGMARYVAEPLGYLATDHVSAFLQEKLDGDLYYFYFRERNGDMPKGLFRHVEKMVALYHKAGLYDVDLHSMNVMVVKDNGEPIPKLFDFNLIPFHIHPPNKVVGLLLKTGLINLRARDLRKLRNFHDFTRVETKLLKFYE
jgi:tRNA A-37 threonylcarbamoyl transferase component Bud32